jgi:phosphopantothenoylcysteine decarboxylase/phosphopantothenate--cysteine ligase
VTVLEPDEGPMACGEYGPGRLPEPPAIWQAIAGMCGPNARPLAGAHRRHRRPHPRTDRSGALHRQPLQRKQGFAIAAAAARPGRG